MSFIVRCFFRCSSSKHPRELKALLVGGKRSKSEHRGVILNSRRRSCSRNDHVSWLFYVAKRCRCPENTSLISTLCSWAFCSDGLDKIATSEYYKYHSIPSVSIATVVPNAFAKRIRFSILTLRSPLSMPPMYVR